MFTYPMFSVGAGGWAVGEYVLDFTASDSTAIADYAPPSPIEYYGSPTQSSATPCHIYNNSLARLNPSTNWQSVQWVVPAELGWPTAGELEADIRCFVPGVQGIQGIVLASAPGSSPWSGYVAILRNQQLRTEGNGMSIVDYPQAHSDGVDYNIKMVWDASNLSYYVNDVLKGTRAHLGMPASAGDLAFGWAGWYTTAAAANETLCDNLILRVTSL